MIKSLNSSKSYGYDNISIKMIKICSESVTTPSKSYFWGIIKKMNISKNMERKTNVVPEHKKEDKTLIKKLPSY